LIAIRRAVQWYQNHHSDFTFVLITDDNENRLKANNDGLRAFSCRDYVESLVDHPELLDCVSAVGSDVAGVDDSFSYPEVSKKLNLPLGYF
jgi:exosome complex exonuclease DIS3/RRP44